MSEVMRLSGVGKTYGGGRKFPYGKKPVVHAVTQVDFAIPKGETLAVVGESGCGKSTLAKMMVGLETPSTGRICYGTQDIATLRGSQRKFFRKDVQYVFQDPLTSLNPRKRIREILEVPLRHLVGLSKERIGERVRDLARDVGLRPEFLSRYPHELSGGQSQRVGVARALAADPAMIILDEPVSALDVSIQAQILALLGELKKSRDLTYVFISHDLTVVEKLADRVCVMYLGRVVEEGTTEEVFSHPSHPYTKLLLESIPEIGRQDASFPDLEGEPPDPTRIPPGCAFAPRCFQRQDLCQAKRPELSATNRGSRSSCFFPL